MGLIIFLAICAVCGLTVMANLIFCLMRGTGPERKGLLFTVVLLGAAALLCFAGGGVPSRMNRYFFFGIVLLVTVFRCIKVLERIVTDGDARSMVHFFSYVTLSLTMVLIPVCMFLLTLSP